MGPQLLELLCVYQLLKFYLLAIYSIITLIHSTMGANAFP